MNSSRPTKLHLKTRKRQSSLWPFYPTVLPALTVTRSARVHSLGVDFNTFFFLVTGAMSALELTFEQGNIELSCPAESPTRSPPTDPTPAPDQLKMHVRGQLQRHVILIPLYLSFSKYFSRSQLEVFPNLHERAACSLILVRH